MHCNIVFNATRTVSVLIQSNLRERSELHTPMTAAAPSHMKDYMGTAFFIFPLL
jgi:hypothetical protein